MRVVVLALLVACASPKPPPAMPCPAAPSEAAIPPEDAALTRWKAIAATKDMAPPAGTTANALVPELVAYLSSIDPERRDHIGYEVLATWIRGKRLNDDETRALMKTLMAKLESATVESATVESTTVEPAFGRSFSALVLAEIVRRDRKEPFLTADERNTLMSVAGAYASRETDLRGYTGATGWSHAAAHTGDLLAQLAQEPAFTNDDRGRVLTAVAALAARKHGQRLAHREDSRLAAAVIAVAKLGTSPAHVQAFIGQLRAPLDEKGTAAFDPGLYYAQQNARDLLFTLFVYGAVVKDPTPGETVLFTAVKALIEE